jgi:hypothetical protein
MSELCASMTGCRPHSSTVTTSFAPSDCTLILRPVLRLFAVNHQPVSDLLPLFTLKPFSSSRFCVPHMLDASGANSASRLLVESSGFVAVTPARFLSGRMSKALAGAAARGSSVKTVDRDRACSHATYHHGRLEARPPMPGRRRKGGRRIEQQQEPPISLAKSS